MSDTAKIDRESSRAAAARISGPVRATPTVTLGSIAGMPGTISLKLEQLQPTGSFKVRGAFNRLLAADGAQEVVAASGGNFGLAVAYAARTLGVRATIFVPASSPSAKLAGLAALDAGVVTVDGYYPEALAASKRHVARNGGLFAHAYDQPEVVAGQGTIAGEIEAAQPDVDTVIVAVGGGGLIGGIASWFRGAVRVVGVETESTPQLAAAFAAGHPVDAPVGGVAASALGSGKLGAIAWEAASRWVDDALLVSDEAALGAQRVLWDDARVVAEPAAATPMAALLSGAYTPGSEERICLVVSGGNTHPGSVAPDEPG